MQKAIDDEPKLTMRAEFNSRRANPEMIAKYKDFKDIITRETCPDVEGGLFVEALFHCDDCYDHSDPIDSLYHLDTVPLVRLKAKKNITYEKPALRRYAKAH